MLSESEWREIVDEEIKLAKENNVLLIGSINASKLQNWRHTAEAMEEFGLEAIELNLGKRGTLTGYDG